MRNDGSRREGRRVTRISFVVVAVIDHLAGRLSLALCNGNVEIAFPLGLCQRAAFVIALSAIAFVAALLDVALDRRRR